MFKLDAIKQRIGSSAESDDAPITIPVSDGQEIVLPPTESPEDYLSSVVQSMSDSLVLLGEGGRITAVNQATLKLLGYEEEDLVGKAPDVLFADGTARGNGLETLHERGMIQRGEKTLRAKDGREIPVFYSGSVLRNAEGRVEGVVCVAHDATKQKQLEQGLRESLTKEKELGQLKSQFVATVSHEFRTPLAIIQTNSELMRLHRERMPAHEQAACFDMIQKQIKHMTRLLEGALNLERMQAGRMNFEPEPMDMDKLCQETIHALQGRVKRKFSYTLHGINRDILADSHLTQQMLTSLLSNAVKFSKEGSEVTVTLSHTPDHMKLEIRDTGIGIPEKEQARLFEPFFRASNVDAVGGTGLGLALTKHGVDLHDGTITVSSQQGVGTTVAVTLPYASKKHDRPARPSKSI